MLNQYLHHPLVAGALSGALAGAAVDISAFRSFKNFDEFASYAWGVAAFRWVQGAVFGALAAAGLGII